VSTISAELAASGHQLSLAQLRAVAESYAEDVRNGSHVPEFPTEERWHVRIHQDDDVDVWLIAWTSEQGTELHDHGGSSGAFTVVSGTLTEYVWSGTRHDAPGMLVDNQRRIGDTIAFGPHYVHDVRNHAARPAVSVHAYSPPIRLMHFYDASGGNLVQWASNWTDDPEGSTPERDAS
jgi:predicted metal-dependent enzyme (double-stranded beta helix superfamily)